MIVRTRNFELENYLALNLVSISIISSNNLSDFLIVKFLYQLF